MTYTAQTARMYPSPSDYLGPITPPASSASVLSMPERSHSMPLSSRPDTSSYENVQVLWINLSPSSSNLEIAAKLFNQKENIYLSAIGTVSENNGLPTECRRVRCSKQNHTSTPDYKPNFTISSKTKDIKYGESSTNIRSDRPFFGVLDERLRPRCIPGNTIDCAWCRTWGRSGTARPNYVQTWVRIQCLQPAQKDHLDVRRRNYIEIHMCCCYLSVGVSIRLPWLYTFRC